MKYATKHPANPVKTAVLSHSTGLQGPNCARTAIGTAQSFKTPLLASGANSAPTVASSPPKRGWHATTGCAPRKGVGSATVGPIRSLKDIATIKGMLANHPRDLALFVVGIHTGLRGSDLLALRWRDVIAPTGDSIADRLEVTESKTGKRRVIALQKNALSALAQWLSVAEPNAEDFIFPGPKGGTLTIQRLHQLVNFWTARAEMKGHFGSHTLRKTYGYHLRRLGVPIETLMKVFGHSSQATTLRYIGIEQQEIDEANLRLSL